MILNVKWYPLNGYDNLNIIVDKFSDEVIFKREKWLNSNERLFVTIYDDGIAHYGLEMTKDPIHGNEKYTWSSRSEVINEHFGLIGTPLQLARHDIGAREYNGEYSCYFGVGYLVSNMMLLAEANLDQLTYDYFKLRKREGVEVDVLQPERGVFIGNKRHFVNGKYYVESLNPNKWIAIEDLSQYYLKHKGSFCLGDVINSLII